MNPSPRTLSFLAASPLLFLLGAPPPVTTTLPDDTALNHWVFDTKDVDTSVLRTHAWEVVAHMHEAHPQAHFEFYLNYPEPEGNELHLLLETTDTKAQREFLDEYGEDDACRALIQSEDDQFEIRRDVYMRLIASDPEKERRAEPNAGLIVWSLAARFPRAGEAAECIEQVVGHLNATYSEFYFRGYDEWFPRSGGLHIYIYGNEIPKWEAVEARIRRDPIFRELMEGAADAFVEGSFEDVWLNYIAR